jgi:hypothetical protein
VHFPYQCAALTLGAMTVKTAAVAAGHAPVRSQGAGRGSVLGGLATMTASAASNQVGAAVGAHAFATIGPIGVVAVRQFVAAAVLLPVARPNVRRFTWAQWWPTLLLGLVFATVPYAADLIALRRVPARFFGLVMSIHPVLAALAGLVILQQVLDLHEWAGILIVVTANVLAVAAAQAQSRTKLGNRLPRPGGRPGRFAHDHQPPAAARTGDPHAEHYGSWDTAVGISTGTSIRSTSSCS